ncbi:MULTISPECIES: Imm26 family immunity protein [unclassified Bacteroides]|uniref:Imm26 family immunity protein n=1 Tax=unclassified Bacteroides TaxID=2646097 RepID=UPI0005543DD8|nr:MULTISPECIES: Imm26 family immunity protein [unclassified Bacteroides]
MKRQKETVGSILEINIENKYFTYAQILNGVCVFFDYRSKEHLKDFTILENAPILFFLCVYKQVITQGDWLKVGKMPIREDCKVIPNQFIQDHFNPDNIEMYITETGEIVPSTREECMGLERCAVWDSNHVEDRIRDHYLGVPCVWEEPMK